MALIRQYRKATNTTYVYDAVCKYDPEKKQTTYVHRRLVGKIDPITNEMVPTGKPGRPRKKNTNVNVQEDHESETVEDTDRTFKEYRDSIAQLKHELDEEKRRNARMAKLIQSMRKLLDMAGAEES